MDADWSVEIGSEAAALELPWHDEKGELAYIDLPGAASLEAGLALIPEAMRFAALRRFLETVNLPPSAWQSAKCDVWQGSCEPGQNAFHAECEQGCYVDLVFHSAHALRRMDFEAHWQAARAIAHELDNSPESEAVAEIVVRRCYFHPPGDMERSEDGYSLTFFLTAYGNTPEDAAIRWEAAMAVAAGCWSRWQERAKAGEVG